MTATRQKAICDEIYEDKDTKDPNFRNHLLYSTPLHSFMSARNKRTLFKPLPNDGTPSWPISHLTTHPPSNTPPNTTPRRAVLVSTGAYSPIHLGHVHILHQAKQTLETHGWHVMGGYISPSHDFYVGPKSKSHRTSFANASHRVAMAELAVQAHDWLAIAKWESRHPNRWPDFTEVAQELSKHLTKEPELTVFFVCGSDHANKCGLDHWGAKGLGLVVVARDRDGVAVTNKTKAEKHVFWCTNEGPLKTSSSTKVRQAIEQNDAPALNALMNPHVVPEHGFRTG